MQTANEKAPFSRSFFIEFRYHFESDKVEVPPGFGPGNKGFADLRLTTWLWHRSDGAVDGIRTRDIHLGKVALYH